KDFKNINVDINTIIIELRKQYLSVPDIKGILDSKGYKVSEKYIYNVLKRDGFARLPRRSKRIKEATGVEEKIDAPVSYAIDYTPEKFRTGNTIGILCLIPYIKQYGIDKAIEGSQYPETSNISKLSSILSFSALKLSNIGRYSADDLWCMDRGLGLFAAGLNVLPKTAWFSSYSSGVTREMNRDFLTRLHNIWKENDLLSDTMNLDLTAIPYWGDDSHLENNWSGKRNKGLSSILALLGQDPDSGIIDYTNSNIRHKEEGDVVLEFLDFYKGGDPADDSLKYLVFDSKLTPYENLKKIDDRGVKFVTIRRRGKNIVSGLERLPGARWKKLRVMNADGKGRSLKVCEEKVIIKDYGKPIRQIAITGHGKIKPALIITNDEEISQEVLIRKYSRRWLIEKGISEQIEFFHLNRVSSSMVIKVDFDLTMTVLSHNLYRLFALNLRGYSHNTSLTLFEKFFYNSGEVEITSNSIIVKMKKKRNLPALLTEMGKFKNMSVPWLDNKNIIFQASSTT
ncbi:MAG: transposase, partial [Oligoflexia bacterium]|nr:transposase [Oligoflexia bacterium]